MTSFDFTNYTFSALVGVFSAIVGMSYPFILQAIGRIDDMYGVTRFVAKFKQEKFYREFNGILLLSVVFAIGDPFVLFASDCLFVVHLFVLTLHTVVILLLIMRLISLHKMILVYYEPPKLLKHFEENVDENLLEIFDLAIYSAKKENVSLFNACMVHVWEYLYTYNLNQSDDEKQRRNL